MRSLRRADLHVGEPLPWPVYDKNGRLLLCRGTLIDNERQMDLIAMRGLFVDGDDRETDGPMDAPANVFNWMLATACNLKSSLSEIESGSPAPDIVQRLRQWARKIKRACEADPDAALASIHLDFHNPYALAHPLDVAVLSALIARRLGVGRDERLSILCAALTADLGMQDLPHLEKQAAALDDEQVAAMQRHTARSVQLLEQAGVDDPVWLDVVLHHHEHWNGHGYPDRLARREIPLGARIIAVADSYAALIRSRPYRPARLPLEAMEEIFRSMGVLYDPEVCGALTKEIGMYPPGSCVRLNNGEAAVVKSRPVDGDHWQVFAIRGADGHPYLAPRPRNAAAAGFTAAAARSQAECRAFESIVKKLWS